MKYLSLFSGIGGFELGIGDRGECIGFSEIDTNAIKIYSRHFNHKNYGDVSTINTEELPDFDLLVGGSPCQDLSVAGKQSGLSGDRSGLFFHFIRILKEKQPRYFIWENVKGTLSSQDGWDFARVQIEMAEAGYSIQWQVLNSADFGVPQSRERIFIVGNLGRECAREVLFELRSRSIHLKEITQGVSDAQRIYKPTGTSRTLKALGGGQGAKTGMYAIPVLTPNRLEKRQNGRRMKEDGEPMFTLTAQDRHGIYDGVRIRTLTPVECERLMGFPDGWTEPLTDNQRIKTLGNAVTVNVVKEIINSLY